MAISRKFGEPPGQTRSYNSRSTGGRMTAAQRKKQSDRAKKRGGDSLMSLPANVVKYYRDNPAMLVEDVMVGIPGLSGIAIGNKVRRGDNADAALSAAALVPGVGVLGKGAKVASVASKASKAASAGSKAGAATVKKTTKKAAAKKTATPAKRTPPPRKPQRVIDKGRKQNIKKMEAAEAAKRNNRPQPKPKDIKTDAPGTGATSGNQQPRPARKPKYKPEKTSQAGKPKKSETDTRDTPMTREEVVATLKKFGFDEAAPFGPRNPGAKAGYDGLENAFKRQKVRDAGKRTKGVTKKTPLGRERAEVQVARRKKAGGYNKVRNADKDKDLGGSRSIAGKSPAQLQRELNDPRSAASRLLNKLEKRARRGNLREGELQTLNRLRDNAPKSVSRRKTEGLMDNDIRSKGQGQPALGERTSGSRVGSIVNPPRKPKASNQKWRGEGGKDAPKGPSGKSGTPKRGDNAAMLAKEEDGVTRIKGKGGQRRRQVAPSQELVPTRKPTTRGRRVGGSSSSGRRPIALGSGRSRGGRLTPSDRAARRQADEPQVIQGEVVRGGRGTSGRQGGERVREPIDLKTRPRGGSGGGRPRPKAIGPGGRLAIGSGAAKAKKGMSKRQKVLAGAALGTAAVGGFLSGVGDAAKKQAKDEKPTPKKRRDTLRDKYGRQISREEYNKREAYRERLKSMTPAERKAARKQEMKRRENYRKGEGSTRFGKNSETITRNLDIREGVSSRKVNKEMKAAAGKSGNRQAAIDARKKYQRKKK